MVSLAFAALSCMALYSRRSSSNNRMPPSTKKLKLSSSDVVISTDADGGLVTTMRSMTDRTKKRSAAEADARIQERTTNMNQRAGAVFTEEEMTGIVHSLQNVLPKDTAMNFDELQAVLKETAHLSHKNWETTGANSVRLGKILLPPTSPAITSRRQMLERILREGGWDGAAAHAADDAKGVQQPWAVLVTGVNGIRKTTSIYQEWFPSLLKEALVAPPGGTTDFELSFLPVGSNTFFRQLDHMIATLCNEDFATLYSLTRDLLTTKDGDDNKLQGPPPPEVIKKYSDLKAAIFTRYRTLSELLGAFLLTEAQKLQLNCMLETSGRDVAMFHYVDHFFPKGYNKLALHFTINDLSHAQTSVDSRMVREIETGIEALQTHNVFAIINSNAGGPYGSEVLASVQADSDRVWHDSVMADDAKVGQDWYKATIQINAHATEPWTAQAVKPDGSLGTEFLFQGKDMHLQNIEQ